MQCQTGNGFEGNWKALLWGPGKIFHRGNADAM